MNEQEKIIELLKKSGISAYKIAKETGISEAAIGNYIAGKSKPNQIYTKCLKYFFDSYNAEQMPKSTKQSTIGNGNIQSGNNVAGNELIGGNINNGQNNGNNYIQNGRNNKMDAHPSYSDCPDVLKASISEKDLLLHEKDERIREKDERIRELVIEKEELKQVINEFKNK
jgi:predicted transcriptional regulator